MILHLHVKLCLRNFGRRKEVTKNVLCVSVDNGLDSKDSLESRLDGNKNEIDDDVHSSDICTSSCIDIENQKDDSFHDDKQSHDISGCEVEAIKESEARKQRAMFEADLLTKKLEGQAKLNHGKTNILSSIRLNSKFGVLNSNFFILTLTFWNPTF